MKALVEAQQRFDDRYRGALSVFIASLSGANLIHDMGYIEHGTTSCFEQVVVMNAIAGQVRYLKNGVRLDKDILALEGIDRVGPGGEYVTSDHTLAHFRRLWTSDLVGDREPFAHWQRKGAKTLGERANEKVKAILSAHIAEALPEGIDDQMADLIAAAEADRGLSR